MAEHSPLRHMMSLSQFSAQTCKSTLWPLHAHIHAWRHNNIHHWRSMIKMALSLPLQLTIVSFAVSWRGHGMYVCCALWLHYSSVGLTLWLWFLAHGFRSGQKSYCHSVEGIELAVNGLCSLKKTVVLPILVIIWQKEKQNNYLMATFHPLPFCLSILGPSATLRESAGLCVTVEHLVPKQVVVICGLAVPLHGKHWLRAQES